MNSRPWSVSRKNWTGSRTKSLTRTDQERIMSARGTLAMQDQTLFSRNSLVRLSEQIGPALRARRATNSGTRFWLRAAKFHDRGGLPWDRRKLGPSPSACKRSVGTERAARPAKAGLEGPIFGLQAAALRRPTPRRRRAWRQSRLAGKWRRKDLKRFKSRREVVWPRQTWTPNIWYWGERRPSPRRVPAASRRGPPKVAESCTIWCLRR